jgi:hypothetical protein
MLLPSRTFTIGFAAGSCHFYQTACDKGLVMEQFGELGTGSAFLLGKVPTVSHGSLLHI